MRLPRPYIPIGVRVQAAERQHVDRFGWCPMGPPRQWHLDELLHNMFGDQKVELHHRPALCNRPRHSIETWRYVPDANDPEFLIYVTKADHDIETRVRGLRGQHSDLGLLRKRKRIERKAKRPKFKWPKRKFPKRRG